jgi:hypothetical protein
MFVPELICTSSRIVFQTAELKILHFNYSRRIQNRKLNNVVALIMKWTGVANSGKIFTRKKDCNHRNVGFTSLLSSPSAYLTALIISSPSQGPG